MGLQREDSSKDPRYLMATYLARFAAEAGIELRTVSAQLLEICGKVEGAIGPLAESYRVADLRPIILLKRLSVSLNRGYKKRIPWLPDEDIEIWSQQERSNGLHGNEIMARSKCSHR